MALRSLTCPECDSSFQVESGEQPECPSCGFTGSLMETPALDLEEYREKKRQEKEEESEEPDQEEPEIEEVDEEPATAKESGDDLWVADEIEPSSEESEPTGSVEQPQTGTTEKTGPPDERPFEPAPKEPSPQESARPRDQEPRSPQPSQGTMERNVWCPQCETVSLDFYGNRGVCPSCGYSIRASDAPSGGPQAGHGEFKPVQSGPSQTYDPRSRNRYCSNCGSQIDLRAEICPSCGVRVEERDTSKESQQAPQQRKKPGIAALLSVLIIGVGQIYNGQVGKGIGFMILAFFFGVLILVGIGLILLPIFWIYNIYDAYNTAKEINAGRITT